MHKSIIFLIKGLSLLFFMPLNGIKMKDLSHPIKRETCFRQLGIIDHLPRRNIFCST